ncbi:hypothetical protein ES703_122887 [subsurface metagenome]
MGVDEVREFQGVANKKYWGVVPDHIIVSLFGIKLHGKSPGIPFRIGRSFLTTYCRKSDKEIGILSYIGKKIGFGILTYVIGNLKIAIGSSAFSVYYPFRNTFTVEMGQFLQQVNILHQGRTFQASC